MVKEVVVVMEEVFYDIIPLHTTTTTARSIVSKLLLYPPHAQT